MVHRASAMDGNIHLHQNWEMTSEDRQSFSIFPQDGIGSLTPNPRKESPDYVSIQVAKERVAFTMIIVITFGTI